MEWSMDIDDSTYRAEVSAMNGGSGGKKRSRAAFEGSSSQCPPLGKAVRFNADPVASTHSPNKWNCLPAKVFGVHGGVTARTHLPPFSLSSAGRRRLPLAPILRARAASAASNSGNSTTTLLDAEPQRALRRIPGRMANIVTLSAGMMTGFWNLLTSVRPAEQPQEIVAVEVNTTGRKRRAVLPDLPGTFPDTPSPLTRQAPQPHSAEAQDIKRNATHQIDSPLSAKRQIDSPLVFRNIPGSFPNSPVLNTASRAPVDEAESTPVSNTASRTPVVEAEDTSFTITDLPGAFPLPSSPAVPQQASGLITPEDSDDDTKRTWAARFWPLKSHRRTLAADGDKKLPEAAHSASPKEHRRQRSAEEIEYSRLSEEEKTRTHYPCQVSRRLDRIAAGKSWEHPSFAQLDKSPRQVSYRPMSDAKWKTATARLHRLTAASTASRQRVTARAQAAKDKDAKVDELIHRAKEAQLGSPQSRQLRADLKASYELRQEEYERLLKQEAEEKLRLEQEAEEKKLRLEREAEEKALQDKIQEKARIEAEYQENVRAVNLQLKRQVQDQLEEEYQEKLDINRQLLISKLDDKWEAKVNDALAVKCSTTVLTTGPEGNDITRHDFSKLIPTAADRNSADPAGWLNDESINAWFAAIVASKKEADGYVKGPKTVPAFESYNSGWLTSYKQKRSMSAIKNWSRRKGIQGEKLLRAEHVFFPINSGSHWTLLIISPKDRKIEFLDSMHGSSKPWFKIAREWLEMELGTAYNADEWTESSTKSSLQDNFSDCGVFTCVNGLASAKSRDFNEVRAENMDQARRLMAAVILNGGFKGDFRL